MFVGSAGFACVEQRQTLRRNGSQHDFFVSLEFCTRILKRVPITCDSGQHNFFIGFEGFAHKPKRETIICDNSENELLVSLQLFALRRYISQDDFTCFHRR